MKRWKSIILGTVLAVLCLMNMTVPALAGEAAPGVSIPVTISLSGTLPRPAEDYTIVLEAKDPAYPMPEGSADGKYSLIITGEDTKSFPTITYHRVGIYTYTIYQIAGDNKKCTYDDSVYTLIVYITNAEDGSGLEATAVLYLDLDGDKVSDVEFKNQYEWERTKPDPKPKPKPEPEPQPEPEPDVPEDPDTPKTGDESQPLLYAGMIAGGLAVFAALFLTRKNKKTEE